MSKKNPSPSSYRGNCVNKKVLHELLLDKDARTLKGPVCRINSPEELMPLCQVNLMGSRMKGPNSGKEVHQIYGWKEPVLYRLACRKVSAMFKKGTSAKML